ncbi:hypothetical protein NMY22_g4156 [Coprinellus aureogranulatus]|nr:hypothetical protein NMY22_g4156 [Coprinellus aureogranulatus]
MPAITTNPSNTRVLITGANGYIGLWTVKTALERGYTVIAVVRGEGKSASLKKLFGDYIEKGKLEFRYITNLTEEGAFDEAVKDVDAILHVASPLPSNKPDPQGRLTSLYHSRWTRPKLMSTQRPFVQPSMVLWAYSIALSNLGKKNVKRIVITSSVAAVAFASPEPRTFTEADWNDHVVEQVLKEGVTASNLVYRASKCLAERGKRFHSAWNFYETHKSSTPWDLTTINPPYVYGPSLEPDISSPSEIGGTQDIWWYAVIDNSEGKRETLGPISERTKETLGVQSGHAWVDVGDLAEAHVRALEKEAAGGERIIVSAGPYIWQEWIDVANALAPPHLQGSLPKGYPELTSGDIPYHIQLDASKSERILGFKYKTKEDLVKAVFEEIERRGWSEFVTKPQAAWRNGIASDYESGDCRFDPCGGHTHAEIGAPSPKSPLVSNHHHPAFHSPQIMSSDRVSALISSLKDSGVIPDVIPEFLNPQLSEFFKVVYPSKTLDQPGAKLSKDETQQEPDIYLVANNEGEAAAEQSYTLVMTDPDAPSRADPKFGQWRHWVIPGLKIPHGDAGVALQKTRPSLTPYFGPAPPPGTGLHRYVFLLFEEPTADYTVPVTAVEHNGEFAARRNWNALKFAEENVLKLVGVNYFVCETV